ncbi:MAG: hypothetical protein ABWZ88_05565, partial [Variovorax sp.]
MVMIEAFRERVVEGASMVRAHAGGVFSTRSRYVTCDVERRSATPRRRRARAEGSARDGEHRGRIVRVEHLP